MLEIALLLVILGACALGIYWPKSAREQAEQEQTEREQAEREQAEAQASAVPQPPPQPGNDAPRAER
jgi:hypothetical protein